MRCPGQAARTVTLTSVLDEFTIDAWAPLNHKGPLNPRRTHGPSYLPPAWTGEENARRLVAYKILDAYLHNVARMMLDVPEPDRRNHREYGDAQPLVAALVGALIGDEQAITVEDADRDLPEAEEGERARIEAAQDRQEWLRAWADQEHVTRKVLETEQRAVGLGDGVYRLVWSTRKRRALLRVYNPGFYFPVLSDDDEEEYPTTVHLAWETEERKDGVTQRWVRRITYRLAPIGDPRGDGTWLALGPDGASRREAALAEGELTRTYRYADEPSDRTVYLSDGRWRLDKIPTTVSVPDLSEEAAEWLTNEDGEQVRDLDLGVDFIPVVHVPNTSAEETHFGASSLLNVAQLLDDLAAADTDLNAAAATTGSPVLALRGGRADDVAYQPGKVFNLPPDGGLDFLDTSTALDALLKYIEALTERLMANARVPGAVLGRVDPANIASGVLLALSFGPLRQVVGEMRLVRVEKYPLLLKFVQRLAIEAGELEGPVLPAELTFGSFLPTDRNEAVGVVRSLIGNGSDPALISVQTALAMLREAGLTIDDATEELERIRAEDFTGATELLDATGDEAAVFEYLGREQPEPEPAPETPDLTLPTAEFTPLNQGEEE